MSNVAENEEHNPATPAATVGDIAFDVESLLEHLTAAHCGIYEDSPANDWDLQFTFRPPAASDVETDPERGGWIRYRCDLTGMTVAVPADAPVPVFLITESGKKERAIVSSIRIHPDFLEDEAALARMLIDHLRTELESAVYEALKALHLLDSLSDAGELPGASSITAASYPRRDAYETVGNRPGDE